MLLPCYLLVLLQPLIPLSVHAKAHIQKSTWLTLLVWEGVCSFGRCCGSSRADSIVVTRAH